MSEIRLALPKGKILEEALGLIARIGLVPREDPFESRKLVIPSDREGIEFLFMRGWDIPSYVEYGAADMGIVGLDVLEEQGKDIYRPLDLGIGFCRMVVAEPREIRESDDPRRWTRVRVATKYPNVALRYFRSREVRAEIIRLSGSVELAPVSGLSSRIVDLVSTGRTLKEHELEEVAEVMASTAHLIVNRTSMRLKHDKIKGIILELAEVIESNAARAKKPHE